MAVGTRRTDTQANGHVHHFTAHEARELFDEMAEFTLDISGDEFLRRWDAGDYAGKEDDPGVSTMIGFLLLVRDR